MGPLVVMPNVELWARDYLDGVLRGRPEPYAVATVDIKLPPATGLPDRAVWVRRDGGPRADLLHTTARLAVNVMCKSETDADDLARLIEALLLSVSATDPVESVGSLSGPTPVTDPSGRPRRYLSVEITARGAIA